MIQNLKAGLRLAFFLPVSRAAFRITPAQCAVIALLLILGDIGFGYLEEEPGSAFALDGLQSSALDLMAWLAAGCLLSVAARRRRVALEAPILALYGLFAPLTLLDGIEDGFPDFWETHQALAPWLSRFFLGWCGLILWRVGRLLFPSGASDRRGGLFYSLGAACILIAALLTPDAVTERETYWRAPPAPEPLHIDAEDVLEAQPTLMQKSLKKITAHLPGSNAYILAFAGDGEQDVFLKEALAAENALGRFFERLGFHAIGHQAALVNHPATMHRLPLATVTNLRLMMRALASKADTERDLLVVYLTSHGAEDGNLSVALGDLALNPLGGDQLGELLEESGFAWKIVIVSACYSGHFIPPLSSEDTFVITASRSDRTSFGCSNEANSTFFGDALLNDALPRSANLEEAFALARKIIAERERREGYDLPSEPQWFEGSAILRYLREPRSRNR